MHVQTLLAALRDAVRLGGELRRRAIMADAIDEREDPFEQVAKVLDEATSAAWPAAFGWQHEVETLRRAIEVANDQLWDSQPHDIEHTIACHADGLPDAYRRVATGHAAAFETLQEIVREWVDPSPPAIRGSLSESLAHHE